MSTPENNTFRNRLQSVRETRGLSQQDLSKKANLPATAVSHFETGTRKPSFDNLKKLADALEVSIDYLMGRVNNMNESYSEDAEIFRDYQKCSEDDRELARDFIARLANRNKLDD